MKTAKNINKLISENDGSASIIIDDKFRDYVIQEYHQGYKKFYGCFSLGKDNHESIFVSIKNEFDSSADVEVAYPSIMGKVRYLLGEYEILEDLYSPELRKMMVLIGRILNHVENKLKAQGVVNVTMSKLFNALLEHRNEIYLKRFQERAKEYDEIRIDPLLKHK